MYFEHEYDHVLYIKVFFPHYMYTTNKPNKSQDTDSITYTYNNTHNMTEIATDITLSYGDIHLDLLCTW